VEGTCEEVVEEPTQIAESGQEEEEDKQETIHLNQGEDNQENYVTGHADTWGEIQTMEPLPRPRPRRRRYNPGVLEVMSTSGIAVAMNALGGKRC
jgi:hypothetical protein